RHTRSDRDWSSDVCLPISAVVGDDEAVDSVLDGELRVLGGEDALDDDLHLGRAAQPLDEVPAHVRRLQVGQAFQIDSGVGGLARSEERRVGGGGGAAGGGV